VTSVTRQCVCVCSARQRYHQAVKGSLAPGANRQKSEYVGILLCLRESGYSAPLQDAGGQLYPIYTSGSSDHGRIP
jgi:hypothetical protein